MIPNEYHTFDDAVRCEITERLDDAADAFDEVLSYTDEHVRTLSAWLIVPNSNGTYTGALDRNELFRLALMMGIIPRAEPVKCPVPWCAGQPYEHGGDGRTPDEFEHSPLAEHSDSFAPRHMLRGEFYQVGNMPPLYRLDAEAPPRTLTLLTVSEVRALADDFERHAVTLRDRATQLEELGGIQ